MVMLEGQFLSKLDNFNSDSGIIVFFPISLTYKEGVFLGGLKSSYGRASDYKGFAYLRVSKFRTVPP